MEIVDNIFVSFFLSAPGQSTKRKEGKTSLFTFRLIQLQCLPHWLIALHSWLFLVFPLLILTHLCLVLVVPLSTSQFSSGISSAPVSASLWYQAKRFQGLPWSEHREGEVAHFFKDKKGQIGICVLLNFARWHYNEVIVNIHGRFTWGCKVQHRSCSLFQFI